MASLDQGRQMLVCRPSNSTTGNDFNSLLNGLNFLSTELLARIEIRAFLCASGRQILKVLGVCWRESKSELFCAQVAVKSSRYLESAARVVVVSWRSPWASDFAWIVSALNSAFSSRSWVACSMDASRSAFSML